MVTLITVKLAFIQHIVGGQNSAYIKWLIFFMPQLDTLSFFTQVFWFVLSMTFFYYIMVNKLIPVISNIFKIRNSFKFVKNLDISGSQITSLDKVMNENLTNIKNNNFLD